MIGVLLLLTVLFDNSLCLSEKGRIALTKAYKGINIEERRERLRNLGLSASEQNTISGTVGQTTLVDLTSEDVLDGESTAVDDDSILAINRREGIDEYLYGGDMILTENDLSFRRQSPFPSTELGYEADPIAIVRYELDINSLTKSPKFFPNYHGEAVSDNHMGEDS
ncbi:unnamed protein product [Haemonchus placei]|uniref:LEM domain-containing protein n=1 Tax=Haemonchus placei TaxID=6290 RepID=A0A0N4X0M1_HAEPC|nr:unnamed protein product [Haemonchus placei]